MEEDKYYDFVNLLDFMSKNVKNFYFYINLLYFIHYINNFPKLKIEKINRLKFYFFNLYKRINTINFDRIHLSDKNDNVSNLFLDEMLKVSSFQATKDNYLCFVLTVVIVLQSYKEICNLIPKTNIFTKPIENKILFIVENICGVLAKSIYSYYYGCEFDMIDVYNLVEKILSNDYFKELKFRQKNRCLYKNFSKYLVDNFSNLENNNQIINIYNNVFLKENIYTYKKMFIVNIYEFLEKL